MRGASRASRTRSPHVLAVQCADDVVLATQINSANELVLTELILDNVFADFEPEEMVALLSGFVFQEKSDSVPLLTPRLEEVRPLPHPLLGPLGRRTDPLALTDLLSPSLLPVIPPQGKEILVATYDRITAVQDRHRANFADDGAFNGAGELKFGLMEVVYEWARGMVRLLFLSVIRARLKSERSPLSVKRTSANPPSPPRARSRSSRLRS